MVILKQKDKNKTITEKCRTNKCLEIETYKHNLN